MPAELMVYKKGLKATFSNDRDLGCEIYVESNRANTKNLLYDLALHYGGIEVKFSCKKCKKEIVREPGRDACHCKRPNPKLTIVPWTN